MNQDHETLKPESSLNLSVLTSTEIALLLLSSGREISPSPGIHALNVSRVLNNYYTETKFPNYHNYRWRERSKFTSNVCLIVFNLKSEVQDLYTVKVFLM